ncbi:hypothetical protein JCM16161A_23050 [Vulcanisaeta sp. JCM 16161]|uniref:hypothetical protein n=1 Tax=Vulcanisaeta sp. JCM 16161 TaxID=1295372 RepID=UPI0006D2BF49|nr:hypothetical protein [Vulcanisaeta sp. JCM 16161]
MGVRVYINNQVLLPAGVVRCLGLGGVDFVDVVIEFDGWHVEARGVRLLKPARGRGLSRQFTIPRHVREEFGIEPLSQIEIEIISVRPLIVIGSRKAFKQGLGEALNDPEATWWAINE